MYVISVELTGIEFHTASNALNSVENYGACSRERRKFSI